MTARLVGIAGPAKGTGFSLDRPEVVIGRDPSGGIVLADPAVLPRHGVVRRRGEQFTIAGCEPDGPVFVNGLPAGLAPRRLTAGDQISVGRSVLLFAPADADPPRPVVAADGSGSVHVVALLGRDEALGVRARGRAAAGARPLTLLASLLEIGTAISAVHGLVALHDPLMDRLLDLVPADRMACVSVTGSGEIESLSGRDRMRGSAIVRVDRALIERALHEASGLLARRTSQDATPRAPAGAGDPTGQILVAPMIAFDRVLGALYLEADDPAGRLTGVHLQMIQLVANMAAIALDNARNLERLEGENRGLQAELALEHEMVGRSPAMRALYGRISRVAPADTTVLIRGESGTGKELIARALHRNSRRASRAFVAVNCAALAETLLESELFGHERGAFTGAVAQKKGRLELADGGTLFLDEIGELPLALQVKLLRALQEREFERVGGTRTVRVDVRIVAATHRDLRATVGDGTFRRDLYYRLNVVALEVPPLRERADDIPELAAYFARTYGAAIRHRPVQIEPAALERLCRHHWPGNVRELQNAVERALVLGSGDTIGPGDFGDLGDGPPVDGAERPSPVPVPGADRAAHDVAYSDALLEVKRSLVLRALQQTDGNFTAAARLLALHPNYLHRLVRTLKIRPLLQRFSVRTD